MANMDGRLNMEQSNKLVAPAADRNKDAILDILKSLHNDNQNYRILEIGSGVSGNLQIYIFYLYFL